MPTPVSLLPKVDLRDLNVEIGRAEKEHDLDFLHAVLHDELVFRRADGALMHKRAYLGDLANRIYDALDVAVAQIDEKKKSTAVTAFVTTRGTANGKPFGGTFRNLRTFVHEDDRWQCRLWINTRVGMDISTIHHVSLPVTDLELSRTFYREILGLVEIERPQFDFPGAWFAVGGEQLHLIADVANATFRGDRGVDSRDVHFAIRVRSFREALELLESRGYSPDQPDSDPRKLKVSPHATAGFPQIYVLDPDRNVIEINAERLDS